MQTSRFTVNQAGARPATFYDEIFPQNNQVIDAGYGQSTAGQVPLSTYKPYYPKIETVIERKITPQDIFRAQNKQVQKIVSAPNLKGYGNRFMVDTSNAPKTGKSDQSTQTPNPTQTRDQGTDAPPNNDGGGGGNVSVGGDDFQSAYGGSQGTVSISSGASSDASTIAWLENVVNVVLAENYLDEIVQAPSTERIPDNRVVEEIKDDKVRPSITEPANFTGIVLKSYPSLPISSETIANQFTNAIDSLNTRIATSSSNQTTNTIATQTEPGAPSSGTPKIKKAVKTLVKKIPMKLLKDAEVQTSINSIVSDIADSQPLEILKEDVVDLVKRLDIVKKPKKGKKGKSVQTQAGGSTVVNSETQAGSSVFVNNETQTSPTGMDAIIQTDVTNEHMNNASQRFFDTEQELYIAANQLQYSQQQNSLLENQNAGVIRQNTMLQEENARLREELAQYIINLAQMIDQEEERRNIRIVDVATDVDGLVQSLEAGVQVDVIEAINIIERRDAEVQVQEGNFVQRVVELIGTREMPMVISDDEELIPTPVNRGGGRGRGRGRGTLHRVQGEVGVQGRPRRQTRPSIKVRTSATPQEMKDSEREYNSPSPKDNRGKDRSYYGRR